MSKLKKIENVTTPIVGKYYDVPCALMKREDNIKYVPIIGVKHQDPQFGGVGLYNHYHIDGRFYNSTEIFNDVKDGTTNCVVSTEYVSYRGYMFQKVVRKRRKCQRLHTGLNLSQAKPITWLNWQKKMIGKSCAGKKCPHLGTTMVERDGVLFCPLHNLKGDIKTEKIIEQVF